MTDSEMNEMEDDHDPMADPDERQLVLSVLDSFRYHPCASVNLMFKKY
jgi:hypothetical protein